MERSPRRIGHPVTEIKVDSAFRLDLEPMIAASKGAGLVFFNNPNNPTATVHGASAVTDFVKRVRAASPDTVILIDEAYHEYVTDPSYQSAVPLALETPNVFVARTFSKAFGMAGLRVGYAVGRAETVKSLAKLKMPYNVNVFGIAAAMAALNDAAHIEAERVRNTAVRAFTVKALEDLGCKSAASQGNFIFTDVGRPAKDFRDACAKQGVVVGRDFPPFEKTHVRISMGTHGRDAEGRRGVPERAPARHDLTRRTQAGGVMALTRRGFVRTAGIGVAGAVTSSFIGARGRENSLWSLVEPAVHAVEPGIIVLASNENPLGPGTKVLERRAGGVRRRGPRARTLLGQLARSH